MNYTLLLLAHITVLSIWILSLLAVSVAITALAEVSATVGKAKAVAVLRTCSRLVTAPAMILTWIFGLTLAVEGGWLGATWLTVKIGFVIALSAIHGAEVRALRNLAQSPETKLFLMVRLLPIVIVFCVLAILFLVMTKPFY